MTAALLLMAIAAFEVEAQHRRVRRGHAASPVMLQQVRQLAVGGGVVFLLEHLAG